MQAGLFCYGVGPAFGCDMRVLCHFLFVLLMSLQSWGQASPWRPGDVVELQNGDSYTIQELIGKGEGGQVFRVSKAGAPAETLAIKRFHSHLNSEVKDGIQAAYEFREVLNISGFLSGSVESLKNQEKILVMPLAEENLAQYMKGKDKAGKLKTAMEIFESFKPALRELMARGFHLGDIKPSNIVRHQETWKILDLDGLQKVGSIQKFFTPIFAAPELRTFKPAQSSSDAYALARTLGELLLDNHNPDSILDREKWGADTVSLIEKLYPEFKAEPYSELRSFLLEALTVDPIERTWLLNRQGFHPSCKALH